MNKKISVVIPFFQRQPGLLRKAVISALDQKGDYRTEIIIVDDGSPIAAREELADLLSKHPEKFIIVEQKNAGCFPAGNTGLNHVSSDSDYIAFLDSDDEWFEGHLEQAVWALDQGYDLYFSDFYQLNQTVTAFNRAKRIDVEKHPRIHSSKPIHEYRGDMVDQIIRGSILGTSTIVYNRKTFAETRYLENYKHTGPEYIFWIQLALRSKKIAFSSAPECRYGGGVNIFSESGWGTDKFLSVRHDEIKFRKYLLQNVPLSADQKRAVKDKIRQSRIAFGRGFLHNLFHNGGVNGQLLWSQFRVDPMTYMTLFSVPASVMNEKLEAMLAQRASRRRN
jgi:succinoglycan biosynthesis protein ExoW